MSAWIALPVQAAAAPQGSPAPPTPPNVAGVTVTAPKPVGETPKLRSKLRSFVGAYGVPAPLGQLARWHEQVCPAVLGLSPEDNDAVAARIKALAVEVGAPAADHTPCRRTVTVFFTDQPQQAVDALRTKAPVLLGYHYPAQTRRLATFTGAIKAWYTTATGGRSGVGYLDDTRHRLPGGNPNSRIDSGIASEFAGVVIVADMSRIHGYELGAVADYVAILALSEMPAEAGCLPLPSIMNLFAADCGAASTADRATAVDLAYLKALYRTSPTLRLGIQQAELVAKMERSLRP